MIDRDKEIKYISQYLFDDEVKMLANSYIENVKKILDHVEKKMSEKKEKLDSDTVL